MQPIGFIDELDHHIKAGHFCMCGQAQAVSFFIFLLTSHGQLDLVRKTSFPPLCTSNFGFFRCLGIWGVPSNPFPLCTEGAGQLLGVPPMWFRPVGAGTELISGCPQTRHLAYPQPQLPKCVSTGAQPGGFMRRNPPPAGLRWIPAGLGPHESCFLSSRKASSC